MVWVPVCPLCSAHCKSPAAPPVFFQALQSHLDTVTRSSCRGDASPGGHRLASEPSGVASVLSSVSSGVPGSNASDMRDGNGAAAAVVSPNHDHRNARPDAHSSLVDSDNGSSSNSNSNSNSSRSRSRNEQSGVPPQAPHASPSPLSQQHSDSSPSATAMPVAASHPPWPSPANSADGAPSEHPPSWLMALASWKLLGSSAASSAVKLAARLRVTVSRGLQGVDGAAAAAGVAVAAFVLAVWMVLARKHVRDALWR